MSTSDQQDPSDFESLRYYAPRRLRDRPNAMSSIPHSPEKSARSVQAAPLDRWAFDETVLAAHVFPEALRPPSAPEKVDSMQRGRPRARRNGILASAIRFTTVAVIAAGIALVYVVYFTGSRSQALTSRAGDPSLSAMPQPGKVALDPRPQKTAAPEISVTDGDGIKNEPLPLGIRVADQTPGATIKLSGLPADTKMTTGISVGAGEWRAAVKDLPRTAVIPPPDFVGQMNIVVELPDASGQSVQRNVVRLMWRQIAPRPAAAQPPQTPEAAAPSTKSAAAAESARQIDPAEIVALIKRGEALASSGDISAARLLLQRAAEAHNARAALELAATYDPTVMKQLGSNSARPDLALAKAWYQKARDWGAPDATKQLEALANANR